MLGFGGTVGASRSHFDDLPAIAFRASRCEIQDPTLRKLLVLADREFVERYPELNGERRGLLLPDIEFFLVHNSSVAVGCCGLQRAGDLAPSGVYEVKRLFVLPEARGTGAVDVLIAAVHVHAAGLGARLVRFETGTRQPEAISVALRHGYIPMEPYHPYVDDPFARCFVKVVPASRRAGLTVADLGTYKDIGRRPG